MDMYEEAKKALKTWRTNADRLKESTAVSAFTDGFIAGLRAERKNMAEEAKEAAKPKVLTFADLEVGELFKWAAAHLHGTRTKLQDDKYIHNSDSIYAGSVMVFNELTPSGRKIPVIRMKAVEVTDEA